MNEVLYAKSDGTTLYEHTVSVINVAEYLFQNFLNTVYIEEKHIPVLHRHLLISCGTHDIGKATPEFTSVVKKNVPESFSTGFQHNVVSWAYFNAFCKDYNEYYSSTRYYQMTVNAISAAILYHHVVNDTMLRTDDVTVQRVLDSLSQDTISTMHEFLDEISKYTESNFGISLPHSQQPCGKTTTNVQDVALTMPIKWYELSIDDMYKESEFFILKAILVYADRIVSKRKDIKKELFENNISVISELCNESMFRKSTIYTPALDMSKYDQTRLNSQYTIINEISQHKNCILPAPAGSGKTLMGLLHHFNQDKRTLWVVPENSIAIETYNTIQCELEKMSLTDKVSVGLLLTGEYIYGDEDSEIIVTNIDNFLLPLIKNRESHTLLTMLCGNVIFDEEHKFMTKEPFGAGFIITSFCRFSLIKTNTLILSATPYNFDMIWETGTYHMIEFTSEQRLALFGTQMQQKVKIDSEVLDDIKIDTENDSIVCLPTVPMVQDAYESSDAIDKSIMHSRYSPDDKTKHRNDVFEHHGEATTERNVVFGSPIIGQAWNISAKHCYDFPMSPIDTIQRLGRTGRFASDGYECVDYTLISLNAQEPVGKYIRGINLVLSEQYEPKLMKEWKEFIGKYKGKVLTKNELYDLYYQFNKEKRKVIDKMTLSFFQKSTENMCRLRPYASVLMKGDTKKLGKERYGWRGLSDQIYVCCKNNPETIIAIDAEEFKEKYKLHISNDTKWTWNEMSYESQKARKKFLMECIDNFKFKYRDRNVTFDEMLRLAKCPDTPFLLCYATYDSEFGLRRK